MKCRARVSPHRRFLARCIATCALALPLPAAFVFAAPAGPGVAPSTVAAQGASAPAALSEFDATSLAGKRVGVDALLGQPTVLIVTPSRDAAESTRAWAQALRGRLAPAQVRIRDLIAIDLPFFMSRDDALARAKEKIPARYHDMTWLSTDTTIERAFGIPRDAGEATVLVLGPRGQVHARASGMPTDAATDRIVDAAQTLASSR